jgi:hypothetical protein
LFIIDCESIVLPFFNDVGDEDDEEEEYGEDDDGMSFVIVKMFCVAVSSYLRSACESMAKADGGFVAVTNGTGTVQYSTVERRVHYNRQCCRCGMFLTDEVVP